jgi:hypothetical protein
MSDWYRSSRPFRSENSSDTAFTIFELWTIPQSMSAPLRRPRRPRGLHPRTVTWVLDAMARGYDNSSYCEGIGPAPPCARYPLDDLLGQDLKTINLSAYGAAGGSSRACPT